MNHLIAKIKTRKREKLFRLFSDQDAIFEIDADKLALVDYEVDHNLDEEAWFKIGNFSKKGYCPDFIKREVVTADYKDLEKKNFTKISYICVIQNKNFLFQKVSPSTYLSKKIIGFGDIAHLEKSETRLCINRNPDAIYLSESDTFVFRKLATISSIFPGIDTLYKEATNEEVQQFLDEDFLELTGDFSLDRVSKPNRARIALAMNTLAEMDNDARLKIFIYIQSYCKETLDYDEDTSKFEIKNDEQLKMLLYGIEERFYTTQLGKQKRLANSVQALT